MPIVSFWSTVDSTQTATTSTIVATASSLALKYNYKSLITQTHFSNLDLETSFFNMDKLTQKGNLDIADTGMDALDRLLRSNKLTPENVANYAKPVFTNVKGSLELLYGTFKADKDSYDRVLETMPIIVDYANQFYDIVLVDLNRGYNNSEINQILQKSDLIVLTLSQDMQVLKKVFKDLESLKILQEKLILPVIGKYDRFSKYSSKNIARNFNYKKPIYTIPYNTQFFDECNDGTAMNFFVSNINANISTDRNGFFISETGKIVDAIISSIGTKLSGK